MNSKIVLITLIMSAITFCLPPPGVDGNFLFRNKNKSLENQSSEENMKNEDIPLEQEQKEDIKQIDEQQKESDAKIVACNGTYIIISPRFITV